MAARVLSYILAVIASAVPSAARATRLFACAQVQVKSTELIAAADTEQTSPAASQPLMETLRALPLQCQVLELRTPVYIVELLEAPAMMFAALEAVHSMQCTTTRREETTERLMLTAQLTPTSTVSTNEPVPIREHPASKDVVDASVYICLCNECLKKFYYGPQNLWGILLCIYE